VNYVLDTRPDAEGHFWWHARREEATDLSVALPGDARRFVTRCGDLVEAQRLLEGTRTLKDFLDEFGDDVDLCWCAVTSPEDAARMGAMIAENARVRPGPVTPC
jgi:hypothetical protein